MSKVNSRAKGIRGELEAAKLWRRWFPDCQRTFGQSRRGGEEAPDIGSPEMNKHFYVEVKRYKKAPWSLVRKWWDKCVADCEGFTGCSVSVSECSPVLMYRADGEKQWQVIDMRPIATNLPWPDFVDETDQVFKIKAVS